MFSLDKDLHGCRRLGTWVPCSSWRNIAITLTTPRNLPLESSAWSSSRVCETQQQGDCHAKRHGSEQKDWRKSGHAHEAKDEESSRDYNSCNS